MLLPSMTGQIGHYAWHTMGLKRTDEVQVLPPAALKGLETSKGILLRAVA